MRVESTFMVFSPGSISPPSPSRLLFHSTHSFSWKHHPLRTQTPPPACPWQLYDNGPHYVYVGLDTRDDVATLRPDMSRLAALGTTAFCVFAGEGRAWKSRVFAPGEGIPEDPATGAAAGPLAQEFP